MRLHQRSLLPLLAAALVAAGAVPARAAAATCRGEAATIEGTPRNDELTGTPGPDVIVTGDGIDFVDGAGGDDLICGGADHDRLSGGPGDDRLYAEGDSDQLDGGAGNDLLDAGPAHPKPSGFVGQGLTGGPGDDTLVGDGDETVQRSTANAEDGAGSTVDLAAGTLRDAGGTDTMTGVTGFVGTEQSDVVRGSDRNHRVFLLGGDDVYEGGGGHDDVLAGDGADRLSGGDGDDAFEPGPGDDVVTGGPGLDEISYRTVPVAVTIDVSAGTAIGSGTDSFTEVENAGGGGLDDVLRGDDGPNVLTGGGGDDVVHGAGGDDTLQGREQHGEAGNDMLRSGRGADVLDGGEGGDTAVFTEPVTVDLAAGTARGQGADMLQAVENANGSPGRDVLVGDAGDNTLSGGAGNDDLDGSGGLDALAGDSGEDLCLRGETLSGCELEAVPDPPTGPHRFRSNPCSGDGAIRGTAGDDELTGTEGDDVICGLGGRDRIDSGGGDDVVYGDGGDDVIYAGAGDDALDGGPGSNSLGAGAGDDFVLGGPGRDVVSGGDGHDVSVTGAGDDEITGDGGNDAGNGGGGRDVLDGGGGSDACIGGRGDDHYRACERCAAAASSSRIAFSRTGPGAGVYVMGSRGSGARRVSGGVRPPLEGHAYEPAWSPDGRRIAFDGGEADDGDGQEFDASIYTVGAKGSGLEKIVDQGESYAAFTPEWSPDGRRIAFESEYLGDESFDLYSVPSGGGRVDELTDSEAGRFHPRYSPDGDLIAAEGNTDEYAKRVVLMDPAGEDETELMPGRVAYEPSWSPGAQWVAIAASPEESTRFDAPLEIFLVHRSGHGATQLTSGEGSKKSPRWSPDGTRILFVRNESGNHNLWVIDVDGGPPRRVTNLRGDESSAQWSPDGERIVFVRAQGRSLDLYAVDPDGRNPKRLTDTEAVETSPEWQPKPCS